MRRAVQVCANAVVLQEEFFWDLSWSVWWWRTTRTFIFLFGIAIRSRKAWGVALYFSSYC